MLRSFSSPLPAGLAAVGFVLVTGLLTPGCGDGSEFEDDGPLPAPELAVKGGLDNPPWRSGLF